MIVLALDTALAATSVALLDEDRILAWRSEPMERGHQEHLAGAVRDTLLQAGVLFPSLDRIGVTIGPGSFTGLRVGMAFARGLALSLEIPCVGIGTLAALAASVKSPDLVATAIDARRERLYLQLFLNEAPVGPPETLSINEAIDRIRTVGQGRVTLAGPGAALLSHALQSEVDLRSYPDPVELARMIRRAPAPLAPPRPLYLRPPDAKTLLDRSRAS